MAKTIAEHRGRPVADADRDALAPQHHFLLGGAGQRGSLGFAAPQRGQAQGTVGRESAPRRFGRHLRFLDY
jgi:hypothetical protein